MRIADAEKERIHIIRDIYAHHVIHGTGSFETGPPGAHKMLTRLEKIRSLGLPWVVALQEDRVIRYCYLTRYRERCAYRYTLEDLIYIDPTVQCREAGGALLRHMIGRAEAQGYWQLTAIVGDNNNQGSLEIHQQAGFTQIGTSKNIGFKYRLWLDTVLLQRDLDEGNGTPPLGSGVVI